MTFKKPPERAEYPYQTVDQWNRQNRRYRWMMYVIVAAAITGTCLLVVAVVLWRGGS